MRRKIWIPLVVLFALGAWDLSRPPSAQAGAAVAVAAIRAYRNTLSPLIEGAGIRCRFTMSCSRYAEVVIARDGLARGSWKALTRILRCGPWTPAGTVDDP